MIAGEPSRTALGAAVHRAVHQDLEGGAVFRDPLAWSILGLTDAERADAVERARQSRPFLRLFIAVRHRVAEDTVAAAQERGTCQVVVLGAGLDTFACRGAHDGLRVFEVDHPATGAWKRERLAGAGIELAPTVQLVGCDFEADDFVDRLSAAGFDPTAPAVFMWLGVVPYLTPAAVAKTLGRLGRLPGAEVVFDHAGVADRLRGASARFHARLAERVAAAGEPFRSGYDATQMGALLEASGFTDIEQLGRNEILRRWFDVDVSDSAAPGGGEVVRARVG